MMRPPNSPRLERVLLHAMQEVLGEAGLRSVIRASRAAAAGRGSAAEATPEAERPGSEPLPPVGLDTSPASISRLLAAFEQVYGPSAGRGLAWRVGRAAFPHGLREYGEDLGLNAPAFRLLPLPAKLRSFGDALGSLFNDGERRLQIEEDHGRLLVHLSRCPFCRDRQAAEPVCLLAVGAAEAALYWLSGGKIYAVEEIACTARGDADCTLQIDQTPLS